MPVRTAILLFSLISFCALHAAEEPYRTVVSEKREGDDTARATTVITEKQIEKKQKDTVAELLRETPGIHISTSGGAGGLTSLFIRGGKGGHALVLLDGVRLNDPFSVENAADLSDIMADGIERIEILRGPQAVIFGPDAMSGAVLITSRGGGGPARLSLSAESGMVDLAPGDIAVNHLRLSAGLRGGTARGDYAMNASYLDTGGYSAAAEHDGNSEEDRARTLTVAGRFGVAAGDRWRFSAALRYIGADADIDNGPGRWRDDPDRIFSSDRLLGHFAADGSLFDGAWGQTFELSVARRSCDDRNQPNGPQDEWGFSRIFFIGDTIEAAWRNDITAIPYNRLRTGAVFTAGQGAADQKNDRTRPVTGLAIDRKSSFDLGLYLQDTVTPLDGLSITAGGRFDLFLYRLHHTTLDTTGSPVLLASEYLKKLPRGTYSVEAAYLIAPSDTTLRASVGSAFKPPSLFQLYSKYGSEFLRPEETNALDGGIEQRLWERQLLIEVNGFYQETRSAIEFSYGCDGMLCGRYQNIGWLTAWGIETALSARPHRTLTITANYTYTATDAFAVVTYDGRDWRDTRPVLRRPAHLANLWTDWNPDPIFNANLGVTVIGPRRDIEYRYPYEPVTVTLPTAVIGSLAVSVRAAPLCRIFGRIENLFDDRYELVKGYGTAGVSLYLGLALDIGGGV